MRHHIQFPILGVLSGLFFFTTLLSLVLGKKSLTCSSPSPSLQPRCKVQIWICLLVPQSFAQDSFWLRSPNNLPGTASTAPFFFLYCFLKEYVFSFKITSEKHFIKWKKKSRLFWPRTVGAVVTTAHCNLTSCPFLFFVFPSLLGERKMSKTELKYTAVSGVFPKILTRKVLINELI